MNDDGAEGPGTHHTERGLLSCPQNLDHGHLWEPQGMGLASLPAGTTWAVPGEQSTKQLPQ